MTVKQLEFMAKKIWKHGNVRTGGGSPFSGDKHKIGLYNGPNLIYGCQTKQEMLCYLQGVQKGMRL